MMSLKTASIAPIAFILAALPAFAQTEQATPPAAQNEAAPTSPGATGADRDAMRQMVREMIVEIMREGPPDRDRRDGRKQWRMGGPGFHGDRRGGGMGGDNGWPRPGMRAGMMHGAGMHGAGMRIVFAVADADGDGALSLAEVQDLQGRIFKAVDDNGDGKVDMIEIEQFFHNGPDEPDQPADDDAN